jgi:uncharacterized protein involved in propanediol utilization
MSLEEQLAVIRDGATKRIPADSLAIMHRATERLQQSGLASGHSGSVVACRPLRS